MSAKIYRKDYWGDADKLLPDGIKNFYYLRHGRTDANDREEAQGNRDNPLNEKGEAQARAADQILAKLPIKKVVSSPLERARRTAELATATLNLQIYQEPLLKERSFGKYEGAVPPSIEMYFNDWETCEPRQDFGMRVAQGLLHCCREGTLIVGHGCGLRTIIGLLGTDVEKVEDLGNAQVLFFEKTATRLAGRSPISLTQSTECTGSLDPHPAVEERLQGYQDAFTFRRNAFPICAG